MPLKLSPLLLLCILAACGTQVSFKQGADAGAFSVADRDCRASNKNYEQCMQAAGWTVHKMNEFAINPLSTQVLSDNRAPGLPSPGSPATPAAPVPRDAQGKVLPPDPMTKFSVAAWGKMGAGPGDLKNATATCVDKLGPAHKPDPDSTLMTRGLILCLKEQGWSGLQGY